TKSERRSLTGPMLNRTSAFLGRPQVELMTCHPETLNFQELITKKKIVLINLGGKPVETEANSLGALFVAAFYKASLALKYILKDTPARYYLYIDEVEKLASEAFT